MTFHLIIRERRRFFVPLSTPCLNSVPPPPPPPRYTPGKRDPIFCTLQNCVPPPRTFPSKKKTPSYNNIIPFFYFPFAPFISSVFLPFFLFRHFLSSLFPFLPFLLLFLLSPFLSSLFSSSFSLPFSFFSPSCFYRGGGARAPYAPLYPPLRPVTPRDYASCWPLKLNCHIISF